MVDVATLALEARTDGLKKAEVALDRVTAAAIKTDAAADRMTAGAGRADAAVGNMGRSAGAAKAGFQNLGYQVQDFAVQVGAGTSASQALGQQLPQLLSGFGMLGVALGTAAAVLVPLAGYFLGSAAGAQSLSSSLDALDDGVNAYTSAVEAANIPTEELILKYGRLAGEAQRALSAMADVRFVETLQAADASIQAILDGLTTELEFASADMLGMSETALVLRDSFGLAYNDAAALRGALEGLSNANGLAEQAVAADKVRAALIGAYGSAEKMPPPLRDAYAAMSRLTANAAEANTAARPMPGILMSARDAASQAASAVAGIGNAAAGATSVVRGLASAMWDAAQARVAANKAVESMSAGGASYLAGQYSQYGSGRVIGESAAKESGSLYGGPGLGVSTGGGAGGSSGGGAPADDGFQAKLDALTESLQTERETTDAWYAESMAIMDDRRAQELLGAQGHADALLAIEAELQKRKAEVRDADLGQYESFFGAMAGALQSGGGKMLAISKGFALAEAAVSIWRGAAKALELPFPASLAAWGQVIGTGAKALAGIKGASFGGGSVGGGSGASVGSSQVTAPSAPDRTIRVNVDGEGLFSDMLRGSIRTIATALGEEQNIGGFVVA